jgi:plasmid stabilization system protein ParE
MRVRYTDPASQELDASISYLLEHTPAIAADFADHVDDAIAQLLLYPYSAQETEMSGVRRKYVRRFQYSIFYTVERDEIVILHVRHAARQWPWEAEPG